MARLIDGMRCCCSLVAAMCLTRARRCPLLPAADLGQTRACTTTLSANRYCRAERSRHYIVSGLGRCRSRSVASPAAKSQSRRRHAQRSRHRLSPVIINRASTNLLLACPTSLSSAMATSLSCRCSASSSLRGTQHLPHATRPAAAPGRTHHMQQHDRLTHASRVRCCANHPFFVVQI